MLPEICTLRVLRSWPLASSVSSGSVENTGKPSCHGYSATEKEEQHAEICSGDLLDA